MSGDRRVIVTQNYVVKARSECLPLERLDVATGAWSHLTQFGDCPRSAAMAGDVVAAGNADATVRVARLSDREAHVLPGHTGVPGFVAVSPDLRWVASAGEDNTLRLWPMPDLDEPPLHTLPHDKLVAKLKSLTNPRATRGPKSPSGWSIELGPFPGWRNLPSW